MSRSAGTRLGVSDKLWITLAASIFALHGLILLGSRLDDPYIFAHYARNVLRYGDVVWNPGEPRIEGFSSWLWLAVCVAGQRLSSNPLLIPKLTGITAGAALVFAFGAELRRGGRLGAPAFAALALLVSAPALAFFAASGMDHIAWCLVAWLFLVWISRSDHIRPRHMAAAALAILVRPEGFILFVPAAAVALFDVRASRDNRTRPAFLAPAAAGAGVLAMLLTCRWLLFHNWLPNAAAAKHLGGSLLFRIADGTLYVGEAFNVYLTAPLVLFAIAIGGGWAAVLRSPSERRLAVAVVSFTAALTGFIVVAGGDDSAAFGTARLVTPLIAPAAFLFYLALRSIAERPHGIAVVAAISAVVILARLPAEKRVVQDATGGTNLSGVGEIMTAWRRELTAPPTSAFALYLRAHTPAGQFVAMPWAGLVPWETDLPTIDLLGLNDAHIARARLSGRPGPDSRYDVGYVLSRKPYFVCEGVRLNAETFARAASMSDAELRALGAFKPGQRALLRDPRLAAEYEFDAAASPPDTTCFRLRSGAAR